MVSKQLHFLVGTTDQLHLRETLDRKHREGRQIWGLLALPRLKRHEAHKAALSTAETRQSQWGGSVPGRQMAGHPDLPATVAARTRPGIARARRHFIIIIKIGERINNKICKRILIYPKINY